MNNQKWIFLLLSLVWVSKIDAQTNVPSATTTNTLSVREKITSTKKQLISKYDVNGNGKIDVQERKGYVREVAHTMQQYAREEAKTRTNTLTRGTNSLAFDRSRSESSLGRQDILQKYDLNHDGRLDKDEAEQLRADRLKSFQKPEAHKAENNLGRIRKFRR